MNDLACDLLFLAGGIVNTGGGDVFIKAKGGCFSIDATKDGLPVAKATMLQLAPTATSRV